MDALFLSAAHSSPVRNVDEFVPPEEECIDASFLDDVKENKASTTSNAAVTEHHLTDRYIVPALTMLSPCQLSPCQRNHICC